MIRVGIGASNGRNSFAAGAGAARAALDDLGPGVAPTLALCLCGGRHVPDAVLMGLRSITGNIAVLGGSCVGLVTRSLIGCEGFETGVMLFPDAMEQPAWACEKGLEQGERETGVRLGRKLSEIAGPDDDMLLFYDSVRSVPPSGLNVASRLLSGLFEGFGQAPKGLVGAGLISDLACSASFIFDGDVAARGAASVMVLPRGMRGRARIMHGCAPISSFRTLTRVNGAEILEIDGAPALDVLLEFLGDGDSSTLDSIPLNLTLGRKHGDPFGPDDEDAFVNRLILGVDAERRSLTLFEADFEEGARVQIMTRSEDMMIESARRQTERLVASTPSGEPPAFGLYIDCAGRSGALTGTGPEEALAVLGRIPPDWPLLGFYSGVEIARVMDRPRPLDWTGVLSVYGRREEEA